MTVFAVVGLLGAGVASGFLNTLAGGGSLLTLPALLLLGLPADVANGTNRLSIVAQSATSWWSFRAQGVLPHDSMWLVFGLSTAGALVGALLASWAPPEHLEGALLVLLSVMAAILTLAPTVAMADPGEAPRRLREYPWGGLGLFLAGVYGGFVQAGVGFILLWVFAGLLRLDLLHANAMKAFCTLMFGSASLAVFTWSGQVAWVPALVLAVGTAIGARLGVGWAVRAPESLRWWLLAAVWVSCGVAWWR